MRSPSSIAVLLPVLLAVAPTMAQAEVHVDFLFGGGHYGHHHHHHGYYDHSWYWYPHVDYVYVAPPPVRYYVPAAPPVTVVPQYGSTSQYGTQSSVSAAAPTPTPTLPTGSTAATSSNSSTNPPSNSLPNYRGPGVTLRNPVDAGGKVAFLIDGRTEMDLAPGESTPLRDKSSFTVEFDRGGDFGTARRVVNEGTYEFVVTPSGWDLQRKGDGAALKSVEPVVRRNELPTTTR